MVRRVPVARRRIVRSLRNASRGGRSLVPRAPWGARSLATRTAAVTTRRPLARPVQLARDTRGAAAVELAFVAPILLLLLLGTTQFATALFLQNNMFDAARQTARQLATGTLTQTSAPAWAKGRLPAWAQGVATVTIVAPVAADNTFTVTISAPLSGLGLPDPLHLFGSASVSATAVARSEL